MIESPERERKTSEVGELIMNRLRRYDKVAYVRFASVYLDFKDVQEFMTELKDLLKTKEPEVKPKLETSSAQIDRLIRNSIHLWRIKSRSSPATASGRKSRKRRFAFWKPPA